MIGGEIRLLQIVSLNLRVFLGQWRPNVSECPEEPIQNVLDRPDRLLVVVVDLDARNDGLANAATVRLNLARLLAVTQVNAVVDFPSSGVRVHGALVAYSVGVVTHEALEILRRHIYQVLVTRQLQVLSRWLGSKYWLS